MGGSLAESDEGAIGGGAGLFGGGEEFASASLEIEVRVMAGLPAVCEEVLVEFVTSLACGGHQGEAILDGGSL